MTQTLLSPLKTIVFSQILDVSTKKTLMQHINQPFNTTTTIPKLNIPINRQSKVIDQFRNARRNLDPPISGPQHPIRSAFGAEKSRFATPMDDSRPHFDSHGTREVGQG